MNLHFFKLRKLIRKLGFCFVSILLWANLSMADPLLINVIVSETGGSYSEYYDALRENLRNSNVTLNILDATQPVPQSSLIIAVGMKAANLVANSNAQRVLNVMIPKSGHKKIIRDYPKRDNPPLFASIYLDQTIERQLSLIAAAFPERHRIGVLYDATPPDELIQLREKMHEYGLTLHEQDVSRNSSVFDTLQKILQQSDILLALPVPSVYNSSTLRNILVSTYQAEIPLVGFSSAYVKAGAICAVFSSPAQFASQTSLVIQKYLETGALPPSQYPKFYDIAVNERVAQSLKINIKSTDEILRLMSTSKRYLP